jgi:hypothetical protein
MAHLTIHVPKEHVDDLRRELLRGHADRCETARLALAAYAESHAGLDLLEGALVEVRDLHDALEQLGWEATSAPSGIALTVHPEVLADALRALAAAGIVVELVPAPDEDED